MADDKTGATTGELSEARKRSLSNLRPPWKKGESANPGGHGNRFIQFKLKVRDAADEVLPGLVQAAKDGDNDIGKWLVEMGYGKAEGADVREKAAAEIHLLAAEFAESMFAKLPDDQRAAVRAILEQGNDDATTP